MLNLSNCRERFCEYILFRYAWAYEFVEEQFPQNAYEYYDSFSKAYRYLIEKIGYQVVYCGVTTSAEQILESILGNCRMKYYMIRISHILCWCFKVANRSIKEG